MHGDGRILSSPRASKPAGNANPVVDIYRLSPGLGRLEDPGEWETCTGCELLDPNYLRQALEESRYRSVRDQKAFNLCMPWDTLVGLSSLSTGTSNLATNAAVRCLPNIPWGLLSWPSPPLHPDIVFDH